MTEDKVAELRGHVEALGARVAQLDAKLNDGRPMPYAVRRYMRELRRKAAADKRSLERQIHFLEAN